MYIIGNRSLVLTEDKAIITYRPSKTIIVLCSILLLASLGVFICGLEIFINENINKGFAMMVFSFGLILFALYQIGLRMIYKIDMKEKKSMRKMILWGMCLDFFTITFPESYEFKFENVYDREDDTNVVKVFLLVSDPIKAYGDRRLVGFEVNAFLKFRILFNNQFSDNEIPLWHK